MTQQGNQGGNASMQGGQAHTSQEGGNMQGRNGFGFGHGAGAAEPGWAGGPAPMGYVGPGNGPTGFGSGYGYGAGHGAAWGPAGMASAPPAMMPPPLMTPPMTANPATPASGLLNNRFVTGMVVGGALTYVLTNEAVQRAAINGVMRLWLGLKGGMEETKERFRDAESEIKASQEK